LKQEPNIKFVMDSILSGLKETPEIVFTKLIENRVSGPHCS
jgi:hypothetical protein